MFRGTDARWAEIPGWPGYEVSTKGHVFSTKRKRMMSCRLNKYNHKTVVIRHNGKRWAAPVHRLMWLAFNGEIPDGYCVCSTNRYRTILHNLRLVKKGMLGGFNGNAKLTADKVREIRRLYKPGHTSTSSGALSIKFRISDSVIRRIVARKIWKYV